MEAKGHLLSQVVVLEVRALDAGELAARVDFLAIAQVADNPVVALLRAVGPHLADEGRVEIMPLLGLGVLQDALEGYLCGVPSGLRLAVARQGFFLGSLLLFHLTGALSLELLHVLCRRLDGDEEAAGTHLDVFRVHGTALHELLKLCCHILRHLHVVEGGKKMERLFHTIDERLVVEISDV